MELQQPQEKHFHNQLVSYNQKSKQKRKKSKTKDDDDEIDEEEKKRRDLKYMNVLEDLSRLRDHYYSVYLDKLETKVEKQRKEIRAREEKAKKLLLKREADKVKKAHQVIRRLPKVVLKNDTEYLRQVPKSRYYHLIAVEELMKSRGLLKQKFQVDDFWSKASQDRSIWGQTLPATLSPDRLTEHMLSRYSTLTSHSKTDLVKTNMNSVDPLPGILKKPGESDSEEDSDERAKSPPLVFPERPKFPKLHSLKINLVSSKPHVPSIASSKESNKSEPLNPERSRKKLEHKLRKEAYEVAVVNTAMTGRLMTKHSVKVKSLKPMSEITEMWCGQSDTSSFLSKTTQSKDTDVSRRRRKSKLKKSFFSERLLAPEHKLNAIEEEKIEDHVSHIEPLSMDMMITNGSIALKKVRVQNPLWTNYVTSDDIIEED